jgi:hypothetical protein
MKPSATRALCVLSAALLPAMGLCDPNSFSGSCGALKTYVTNTGVMDVFGGFHPGAVAITAFEPHEVTRHFTNKKQVSSPLQLQRCYTAVAHVGFKSEIHSTQITWTPAPFACDTAACANELTLWQNYVQAHEADHRDADESYVHSLQTVLANYPVQGCASVLSIRGGQTVSQAIQIAPAQQVRSS